VGAVRLALYNTRNAYNSKKKPALAGFFLLFKAALFGFLNWFLQRQANLSE